MQTRARVGFCPTAFVVIRGVVAVLALFAAASSMGCGEPESPDLASSRPNLLLLTVDTLRSDHLSGYGYSRPTSPALDAFFESAVVFDDAHANSAWTLPSLASMMTSLHPSAHGCINFKSRLDSSYRTLAEILRDAGYRTHGIASHTFLREIYGLQQGFQQFDEELALNLKTSHQSTSSPQVTQKVVAWLDENATPGPDREPWFLWGHYFDPHFVYIERPSFAQRFGSEPIDLYDGEVAFTDLNIGIVLDRLAQLDLLDSTVVVFTSDHGEAFGEHGHDLHGSNLFREITQVPLAIYAPGIAPRRVAGPVEGVDLMPTILDLLGVQPGIDPSSHLEPLGTGRSLVPALRGETLPDRALLLETQLGPGIRTQVVIDGRWKLIADWEGSLSRTANSLSLRPRGSKRSKPVFALIDRVSDPNEQVDVSTAHPTVVKRLREQLDTLTGRAEQLQQHSGESAREELSEEELDALRALGYIDTGPDESSN